LRLGSEDNRLLWGDWEKRSRVRHGHLRLKARQWARGQKAGKKEAEAGAL
jgi:hypothetical protein